MIIINADDYGLDIKTNDAIIESFYKGYISSTTLMANMAGFDDACEKARMNATENSIGIHLNLTSGHPLTEQIKSNARFCDANGNLFRNHKTIFYLSKMDKLDVYAEYSAQIQKVISSGIIPTHLDSHHHFHTEPALISLVCHLAKSYHIKSVRLSRNCGDGISKTKNMYKTIANKYIKNNGLSLMDYFGSVEDVCQLNQRHPHNIEIMVHPIYLDDGTLIDATNQSKMSDNFNRLSTKFIDLKLKNYSTRLL